MSAGRKIKIEPSVTEQDDTSSIEETTHHRLSRSANRFLRRLASEPAELTTDGHLSYSDTAIFFNHYYHGEETVTTSYNSYSLICAELSHANLIKRIQDSQQQHRIIKLQHDDLPPAKRAKLVAIKEEPQPDETETQQSQINVIRTIKEEFIADSVEAFDLTNLEKDDIAVDSSHFTNLVDTFFSSNDSPTIKSEQRQPPSRKKS